MRENKSVTGLLTVGFLGLVGCPIAPSGPKPIVVEPASIRALDLIFVGAEASYCAHGSPPQVRVVVTRDDSTQASTNVAGESADGKVNFNQFELSSSKGTIDGEGFLRISNDPFDHLGAPAVVTARLVGRPEMTSSAEIVAHFDCAARGGVAGASGRSPFSARSGQVGQRGNNASSSAGSQNGQDGGHGESAGDGGHAGHGGNLKVAVTFVESESHGRLMLVKHGATRTLLGKKAPPYLISSVGGAGGSGGDGGSGGSGGNGGDAQVEDSGNGGDGGNGGSGGGGGVGGDGGDGGSVTMLFDQRFPELKSAVQVNTSGGQAGRAGRGGRGGSGGTGGTAKSGSRGQNGQAGAAGRDGRPGRDGRAGRSATFTAAPAAELFEAEISAGVTLAKPSS